jgi:hypothetical protein
VYLYGLNVSGLTSRNVLTGSRELPWHEVMLEQTVIDDLPTTTGVSWSEESVTLDVASAFRVDVTRRRQFAARVSGSEPMGVAELVHPIMVFVGAAVAWWTGRHSFHAATVVLRGRAWLLLGTAHGGKSTLAACLHARGHEVLGDDLAVLDGRTVLAGPRFADLRESAAAQLGVGRLQQTIPGRDRWRTGLGTAPYEVPLGGMVVLEWGDTLEACRADPAQRLSTLAAFDALGRGPVSPTAFLDLLDVPSYVVRRPREWSALDATASAIEEVASRRWEASQAC